MRGPLAPPKPQLPLAQPCSHARRLSAIARDTSSRLFQSASEGFKRVATPDPLLVGVLGFYEGILWVGPLLKTSPLLSPNGIIAPAR